MTGAAFLVNVSRSPFVLSFGSRGKDIASAKAAAKNRM